MSFISVTNNPVYMFFQRGGRGREERCGGVGVGVGVGGGWEGAWVAEGRGRGWEEGWDFEREERRERGRVGGWELGGESWNGRAGRGGCEVGGFGTGGGGWEFVCGVEDSVRGSVCIFCSFFFGGRRLDLMRFGFFVTDRSNLELI